MNKNLKKIRKNITGESIWRKVFLVFNHLVTEYHTYGSWNWPCTIIPL